MGFVGGSRLSSRAGLLGAAGLGRWQVARYASGCAVCRAVAFHVARRDCPTLGHVLDHAEGLLASEADYPLVLDLLECLQNLVSHGVPGFRNTREVETLLGERSRVCWETLDAYWSKVAAWRLNLTRPVRDSGDILGVRNRRLQALLWTSDRSVQGGGLIGLGDVIRYQKNVGDVLPGYSHIARALAEHLWEPHTRRPSDPQARIGVARWAG